MTSETPDANTIVVLYDSLMNGSPERFRISRTAGGPETASTSLCGRGS